MDNGFTLYVIVAVAFDFAPFFITSFNPSSVIFLRTIDLYPYTLSLMDIGALVVVVSLWWDRDSVSSKLLLLPSCKLLSSAPILGKTGSSIRSLADDKEFKSTETKGNVYIFG